MPALIGPAFILVWIAIAEGLKWRYEEMSNRDGALASWFDETEKLEAAGRSIDSRLLDQAKKYGIITESEHKKLTYIKDMRNSYAHPTGSAPSQSEVDAVLEIAASSVLARPPLLGHGFARELVLRVLGERHYLDDDKHKVAVYGVQLAPHLQASVLPWLIGELITGLPASWTDPALSLYVRRATWLCQTLITCTADDLTIPPWKVDSWLGIAPSPCAHIFAHADIYPRLSPRLQDMVFGNLAEPVNETASLQIDTGDLSMLVALRRANLLHGSKEQRLMDAILAAPYEALVHGAPLRDWIGIVLDDLKSRNWYRQNPATEALATVGPEGVRECGDGDAEDLGRALLAAADGSAIAAERLLAAIRSEPASSEWPVPFVSGLLLECIVREDGGFRIKPDKLGTVLDIVSGHSSAMQIEDKVAGAVRESHIDAWGDASFDDGLSRMMVKVADPCSLRLRDQLQAVIQSSGVY